MTLLRTVRSGRKWYEYFDITHLPCNCRISSIYLQI